MLPHELPPNTFILPWREAGTLRQLVLSIRWMWDFRSPE